MCTAQAEQGLFCSLLPSSLCDIVERCVILGRVAMSRVGNLTPPPCRTLAPRAQLTARLCLLRTSAYSALELSRLCAK